MVEAEEVLQPLDQPMVMAVQAHHPLCREHLQHTLVVVAVADTVVAVQVLADQVEAEMVLSVELLHPEALEHQTQAEVVVAAVKQVVNVPLAVMVVQVS
jgi:hypothetical protein